MQITTSEMVNTDIDSNQIVSGIIFSTISRVFQSNRLDERAMLYISSQALFDSMISKSEITQYLSGINNVYICTSIDIAPTESNGVNIKLSAHSKQYPFKPNDVDLTDVMLLAQIDSTLDEGAAKILSFSTHDVRGVYYCGMIAQEAHESINSYSPDFGAIDDTPN